MNCDEDVQCVEISPTCPVNSVSTTQLIKEKKKTTISYTGSWKITINILSLNYKGAPQCHTDLEAVQAYMHTCT